MGQRKPAHPGSGTRAGGYVGLGWRSAVLTDTTGHASPRPWTHQGTGGRTDGLWGAERAPLVPDERVRLGWRPLYQLCGWHPTSHRAYAHRPHEAQRKRGGLPCGTSRSSSRLTSTSSPPQASHVLVVMPAMLPRTPSACVFGG